jgi:hypothetical protein
MDKNQRSVGWQAWHLIQQLELHGGPGESFDTMNTGGVHKRLLWRFRAEPSDIDAERTAGRSAGSELQRVEPAARSVDLITKAGSCFFVVGREVS